MTSLTLPHVMTRLAAALAVLFMAMLGYLVFFEPPWLTYTNLPFRVLNSPVKVGTAIQMEVSRCSTARVSRVYGLARTLTSGTHAPSVVLPAGIASVEPGCSLVVSAANIVPVGVPSGTYRLRGQGEIQGIVRTHSVEYESEEFEVVQ